MRKNRVSVYKLHEIRMWAQWGLSAASFAYMVYMGNPQIKESVDSTCRKAKDFVKSLTKK